MMDCKVHEVKENHLTLLFGGRKTHICKRFERETDLLVERRDSDVEQRLHALEGYLAHGQMNSPV